MKLAILTVSSKGHKLAEKLKDNLKDDPTIFNIDIFHKNIRQNLINLFQEYDAILGIMATGIMVRSIKDLISHKTTDPAVMVMDEAGLNIISLISGHLGGANYLTNKIAKKIGSNPVITTATDVNGLVGIDELARRYYWHIENPEMILHFNRAILEGKKVQLFSNSNLEYIFTDIDVKKSYLLEQVNFENLINSKKCNNKTDLLHLKSITTDHKTEQKQLNHDNKYYNASLQERPLPEKLNEIYAFLDDEKIIIHPCKLVVGVGSRKGISMEKVLKAIEKSFEFLDIPIQRINSLASATVKSNEKGILETAHYLNVNFEIVTLEDIKQFSLAHQSSHQCSSSEFVYDKFGVQGICEPAALLAAGNSSKLIIKKTAYDGVTVAVAVSMPSSEK